ncbi:MAG TPA: lipocalin family protein, partial [Prolixibacteraceae bacterium]|nr:lipocalin family protein [Prolixibacteraceae bacterium]
MMNQSKNGKAGVWKVAIFLPVLALLLMSFGRKGENVPVEIKSSQVESTSIMGTWKLVAYSYGGTWQDLKPVSSGSERIKFITEKNFTWVQYADKDKIVVNSAGGSYTYSGNDYTEKIEFGGQGMAGYIGKEHKFKV